MAKTIKDKGLAKRFVNPKAIARSLGAEEAQVEIDTRRGPISLFSLRQSLVKSSQSTTGKRKGSK